MRCCFGHFRYQSCRRRPTADHHHPFACVVQISWPELRIDQRAFERRLAWKVRLVAFGVAVVAAAQIEKAGLELTAFTRASVFNRQRPAGLSR